jgi:hypothetical protein
MRTRIAWCAGILLCLVGSLYAQGSTTWVAPNGGQWSVAANWAGGVLPSAQVKAFFNGPSACVVDVADAGAWQIDLAGGPLQIVQGGNLTVTDWFILGYQAEDTGDNAGRLEVYDGGVLNCMVRLYVGYRAEGFLTIYEGGTVNIHTQTLGVGQQPGGKGLVTLEGGTLNLLDGTSAQGLNLTTPGAQGNIDCRGGAMILPDTPQNRAYLTQTIDQKLVTAYGGLGTVVVDPNETRGKLTVRGIHPLQPFPRDDGAAPVGQVELTWVSLDPCTPGQPVPVDVYFTDDLDALLQFSDPAAIRIVTKKAVTSTVVQTQPKRRYYWAVDSYVGSEQDPVLGPIFSFMSDNLPPTVDAGADIVTWLENGSRTGKLDATITDDGGAASCTAQWTVVSEPNEGTAILTTPQAEDTDITLLAAGRYVLQLDVSDGEYTGSDTVTINVYHTNCEAAQSVPGYQPLVGDLNGDCRVDDLDLALLQENWLKDNSLTDDWLQLN